MSDVNLLHLAKSCNYYHRGKKYRGGTRALLRYFRIRAPSSGVEVRNVNKRTCQYSEAVKYHNKYVSANNAFINFIYFYGQYWS